MILLNIYGLCNFIFASNMLDEMKYDLHKILNCFNIDLVNRPDDTSNANKLSLNNN